MPWCKVTLESPQVYDTAGDSPNITIPTIAVVSTTPWDSYLIRTRIWTYPPDAILGPTLFSIPSEEIFFFVIQTYNTSVLYLLLSKPTFHPMYLKDPKLSRLPDGFVRDWLRLWRFAGQMVLVLAIKMGVNMVKSGGKGMYMGMILVWACPFLLMLWTLAYQLIIGLPISNTVLPIALPTLYLWIVDTLALKRGTWVIESGTKLGINLWDGLEIEEATFFLFTNTLIVFGLIAFDNALAILNTFPSLLDTVPELPSPILLVKALLIRTSVYDKERIIGLAQALARLRKKSRSFYLASGVFQGRLRLDLVLLVADDLVDDAESFDMAQRWISKLFQYLDIVYGSVGECSKGPRLRAFVLKEFPASAHSALLLLPTQHLTKEPLYDLIKGFEMDLSFGSETGSWPIKDEDDLRLYASRVAGTVAELCLQLVYHHTTASVADEQRQILINAGGKMGIALQFVNIARDIAVDAKIRRVYLPTVWLEKEGLKPENVIEDSCSSTIIALRKRLLEKADEIYLGAKGAIEDLPSEARAPMRVAVESYMEIGRVLREKSYTVRAGRATVPKLRRIKVAWRALGKG
ncbi:MAG: hypothetical protein M1812_007723 [Candelaria pacifica]|nr:MAG: hypothetical protein M1812_007723 [Candelaria pacifica]